MIDKPVTILCIGKLKTRYWADAFEYYRKMFAKWQKLMVIELKDADGNLPVIKRLEQEGEKLLKKMTEAHVYIALSERGAEFASTEFANWLATLQKAHTPPLCFIIGGAYGLASAIITKCDYELRLSSMTWPHELARVLLMEQLYRAGSILSHGSYHH